MDAIIEIINQLAGSKATIIMAIVGACSVIAVAMPAPNKETTFGKIYTPFYVFFKWFGQNYGHSANADDVAKR